MSNQQRKPKELFWIKSVYEISILLSLKILHLFDGVSAFDLKSLLNIDKILYRKGSSKEYRIESGPVT